MISGNLHNEIAFSWLESRGKISITSLFKENENVKKNSRFFESYKTKRTSGTSGSPSLNTGTGPRAEGPGSELPDNRAGDSNADNIKWDGNKKRGGYTFRTYTEESPSLKVNPIPKENNFSKDKEKVKRNRFTDAPTVNQRMRNITTVGPEFDTRQQGTVYPMSGLGDVTYRESYNNPADTEMGVSGVLGGATNKEPMENPRDKFGSSSLKNSLKKKKK